MIGVKDKTIVPSVMFHSVGLENHNWVWSHIAESLTEFEEKLQLINARRYHTIFWDELYYYMEHGRELPPDSIFLTFDDGYLDNWIYVFPLLKKYRIKATIFVNPEFVDPRPIVRKTLEDCWNGNVRSEELELAGFLSWEEMRLMEASGLVDIQSHALTHTWYPKGPAIVDFHRHQSMVIYPWLFWNQNPSRKPYYLNEDQQGFIDMGTPVFEHAKSLIVRKFTPDAGVVEKITRFIQQKDPAIFSQKKNWREEVFAFLKNTLGLDAVPGEYEALADYESRVYGELQQSKQIIGQQLNKTVEFICWPGGGNDPLVQELARRAGYKSWTLGSADQSVFRNRSGVGGRYIKRLSSVGVRGHLLNMSAANYFMHKVAAHQGSAVSRNLLRLINFSNRFFD